MTATAQPPPQRPAPVPLAAQVLVQAAGLAGQEMALAKAEMKATARRASASMIMLAAAGLAGISAWGLLLAAAVIGIGQGLPYWGAALIMMGVVGAPAGLLTMSAYRRLSAMPKGLPLLTQSIHEDLEELRRSAAPDGAAPGAHMPHAGPVPESRTQ